MEYSPSSRVITLTQGQTEFNFPPGFGVPVASNENWMFTFQAANRTTDKHRRVKQLLTLSLIKDSELVEPIKALSWFAPYIKVVVDRDTPEAAEAEHKMGPGCLGTVSGVTAPNSVPGAILTDSLGRRLSGHWVVPPGVHAYASPINQEWDPGFASKKRRIHAVWSHVHPLCTEVSLGECGSTDTPDLFKVSVQTKTEGGLELKHIDSVTSKEGIVMQPGKQYQVKAKYDNTTGKPQDSMIVIGVFYADEKFARPDWVLSDKNEAYCGVTASGDKTCSKAAEVSMNNTETDKSANATNHVKANLIASAPAIAMTGANAKSGASVDANPGASMATTDAAYPNRFPSFDVTKDGPLLTEPKTIEIQTSGGPIASGTRSDNGADSRNSDVQTHDPWRVQWNFDKSIRAEFCSSICSR